MLLRRINSCRNDVKAILEFDEERTTTLLDSLSILVGPNTRVSLAKRASEIALFIPVTNGLACAVGRIITALLTDGGNEISERSNSSRFKIAEGFQRIKLETMGCESSIANRTTPPFFTDPATSKKSSFARSLARKSS